LIAKLGINPADARKHWRIGFNGDGQRKVFGGATADEMPVSAARWQVVIQCKFNAVIATVKLRFVQPGNNAGAEGFKEGFL